MSAERPAANRQESAFDGLSAPTPSTVYESLPKEVQDALRAADRLLAGIQAGVSPDLFDRIAEPYDGLSFLLDRIGAPRV